MRNMCFKKGLVLGIIVFIVGAVVIPTISGNKEKSNIVISGIDDGLVGYWSFDNNEGSIAYDESGNDNNGLIEGASWTLGISGNALDFDGINDYVYVPSSSSLNFGHGDFSILAWVKTDNSKADDIQIIEKMDRIGGQAPFRGYYFRVSHHTYHENNPEPCLSDGINDVEIWGDDFLADNEWHFIVATFDRDDKLKLYVDGEFDNSEDINIVGNIDVSNPLYIGQQDNSDNRFVGQIDEIRLYNRVVSKEEISELFNNPGGLKSTIMFGRFVDKEGIGNLIIFNAVKIRGIQFSPFNFITLKAGERIKISENYRGLLTSSIALGIFKANI